MQRQTHGRQDLPPVSVTVNRCVKLLFFSYGDLGYEILLQGVHCKSHVIASEAT
jgi:hypothetical protein